MGFDTFFLKELGVAVLIFFISHFSIRLILRSSSKNLPPGPRGWPIFGALPLLGTMPHVTLTNMAKKFGPIMFLKMGTCDTVVASSPAAAQAFLKTLGHNFLNRPTIAGATHLGYNAQDLVFANYGPKWKLLRKLTNQHMLGGKALNDWAHVRENEVKHMLREMHNCAKHEKLIEVIDLLSCAITNMVSQVVLSHRMFSNKGLESKEFKDMVVEFMTISGVNIGDFVPCIAWMDLQGVVGKMKRLHKRFDVLLTKIIEEHVKSSHERKGKPDFLDIVMANEEDPSQERLTLSNIKALLLPNLIILKVNLVKLNTFEAELAMLMIDFFGLEASYIEEFKEGASLSDHLNEFQGIFYQMSRMDIKFEDEILGLLLLNSLSESSETFKVSITNSAPNGVVILQMIKGSILKEEIRRKTQGSSSRSEVLVTENKGRS
ncbi:Flavonoid 3',5'-hydroxylase 1, partial [Mucuna pruriens]